jgi:hypothetical protein
MQGLATLFEKMPEKEKAAQIKKVRSNHPPSTGLARLQLIMGCCSNHRTKESHDENGSWGLHLLAVLAEGD